MMSNTGGLLNRANHVGEQSMGTITGLYAALDEINPQDNLAANAAPTANDDRTSGYQPRSIWIYNGVTYRCIDATPGAAVWVETGISAEDLGSAAFASTSDFDPAGAAQAAAEFARQRANQTGTQPLSTIEGVGAAASRNVVGGSGDLMAQGAFGLGLMGPNNNRRIIDDVNNERETGLYYQFSGALNRFLGLNALHIELSKAADGFAGQIALVQSSNAELGFRTKNSGTFTEWRKVFHDHNILGTVSQSNGIPTGAIIERGSNANGEYVKFADGRLICSHIFSIELSSTVESGVLHRTDLGTFDFPSSEFVNGSADYVSGSKLGSQNVIVSNHAVGVSFYRGSNLINEARWSNVVINFSSPVTSSPGELTTLALFAIGRWY